jgi:hypothetical protein
MLSYLYLINFMQAESNFVTVLIMYVLVIIHGFCVKADDEAEGKEL